MAPSASALPSRLRFAAYEDSREVPNVVVDGGPNEATVLTLSHWPRIAQPAGLGDDLSAQMAYRYLDTPTEHPPAEVVTNNHFDQDGLVGVHALIEPEAALRHRDLLVDVAAAGDFGTYRFRDAARASMAIWAYSQPDLSPISEKTSGLAYPDQCALLYETTLPLLVDMATRPDGFRELWGDEDDRLTASERALSSGAIVIDEYPEVDLAVVTVDAAGPLGGHRFGHHQLDEVHPFAINNATDRVRLLIVHGRRYRYFDRYETWVQFRSRSLPQRVDMAPLADRLNGSEADTAGWVADRPSIIMPAMTSGDESSLAPELVVAALVDHLRSAPPAWDPYSV